MPTNLEDKLAELSAIVINDAREKRERLLEETEREYNERIDKKETELLEGAYNSIQKNIRDIDKASNTQILNAGLEAKRGLILKREEIIGSVVEAAKEKLCAFIKTADYEKWLKEKTAFALKETGEGRKTVYLYPEDMRLEPEIGQLDENITIAENNAGCLSGGVRVVNTDRRIAADYTFEALLEEQKQKFLKESTLALD